MSDEYGYIYCFSNPCMPGIVKIGMTDRTPEARLSEANASDTWRPPTPYKIEFAKKVLDASVKEKILHTLLEEYTDRINSRREFFRVSPEKVRIFVDLMDGEMWVETQEEVRPIVVKRGRDMAKCFTSGQRIRHTISDSTRIGIYDSSKDGIVYDGTLLSIYKFASNHYAAERPDRTSEVNGWKECEYEVDGNWVSTFTLPG